ncbi:MAG: YlbF family regulator [Halanaerobiaceae bacterium]
MALIEKAEALADEIVESSEFKEMKRAEKNITEDDKATELMEEFQSAQQRVQMAQMNGQSLGEDKQKEIQNLQAKMQSNPKISEFIEAQQNFSKVMETVNQTISEAIENSEAGSIITE